MREASRAIGNPSQGDTAIPIAGPIVTHPGAPQFDIATDMWNPLGVTIWRKGACSTIALRAETSSASTLERKSVQYCGARAKNILRESRLGNTLEECCSHNGSLLAFQGPIPIACVDRADG